MRWRWLWLAPLTLLWPALQLGLFALRFGRLPPGGAGEALVFAPMGAVAGTVLLALLGQASAQRQRRAAILGYGLAAPVALVGTLVGGLMLPPLAETLLFGAMPLVAGAALGFWAGARG